MYGLNRLRKTSEEKKTIPSAAKSALSVPSKIKGSNACLAGPSLAVLRGGGLQSLSRTSG